jgi:glucose-6-phosphate-specific signal transduction histidine kinase
MLWLPSLEDALESQGLFTDLTIGPEISTFAYQLDIVIVAVYHSWQGAVLVMVVKTPGNKVFTSHNVGGQVYDYLVGELGMGVTLPFAIQRSYEATCLAHLNDKVAASR